ncbi:MAG: 4Fe-4S dicluster domain-containing protein [Kiritimatiellia bacterium]
MPVKKVNEGKAAPPHPVIDAEECKGCRRCISACPRQVLRLRAGINHRGVQPAEYLGCGCTGCGICFYNCPEPYVIRVETPEKTKSNA